MSKQYQKFVLTAIILLGLLFAIGVNHSVYASSYLTNSLDEANSTVIMSFESVSCAKKAGANVDELTNQLNAALNLLDQAEIAQGAGDETTALKYANNVISIAESVTVSAQAAKLAADNSVSNSSLLLIMSQIMAAIILVTSLVVIWLRVKKTQA